MGRISGLPGPATGALGSELSSEDPKGGRGEKGQCGAHTGLPHTEYSLPPSLRPHVTLGKSLNFSLVCIPIHQLRAGINLSPHCLVPLGNGTFDTYVWQQA